MNPDPRHPDADARTGDSAERLARSRADIARWLDGQARPAARPGTGLPSQAARLALDVVAHRHPWGLMGAAAAAGALLTVARPWRWLLRSGVLVAVASPVVSDLASRWLRQALASPPPASAPPTEPDPPL